MSAKTFLVVGYLAAAVCLERVWMGYHGTVEDQVALVFALKTFLIFPVALHFVWYSHRPASHWAEHIARFCERRILASLAALIAVSIGMVFLSTPQVGFGLGHLGMGYGHDGVYYGQMTENFAWFRSGAQAPFSYRPLAPMLVHYSGLNTFRGFYLLNLASYTIGTLLFYRIGRHFSLSPFLSLTAAALFATLKFFLKFIIYYPVTTDGIGMLLLLVIIYATLERKHALYLVAMIAGAYCRENLIVLALFNALYVVRTTTGTRRFITASALQILPVVVWMLSQQYPIFAPLNGADIRTAAEGWGKLFLFNADRQQRVLLAFVNSLGVLFVLVPLSWRQVVNFLAVRYEWSYYMGINVLLCIVGGVDTDRFAVWLAPVAVFALLASPSYGGGPSLRIWIHWLVLQAISMELFLPWFPDERFYLSRYAVHSPETTVYVAVFSGTLIAVVIAMWMNDEPYVLASP